MKKFILGTVLFAAGSLLFAGGGTEKKTGTYPSKQIRLIVQANPGGVSDLGCRTIAPGVEKALSVPIVVENMPGAGGGVAISWGAAQPPDGYMINHLPNDIAMLKPSGAADVTPDDFEFICRVALHACALAVRSDSKYKTFQDFINDAKARPGQLSIANSGIGAIFHVAAVRLENATGAKFTHIPFEGGAPAVTAALGGHVDAVICSSMEAGAQVLSGDLKYLAMFSDERLSLFPDAPTFKELGYDLVQLGYLGFGVPKGTDKAKVDILAKAFKESYDSATFQDMLKSRGLVPGWLGPDEYTKFVKEDFNRYMDLIPKLLSGK